MTNTTADQERAAIVAWLREVESQYILGSAGAVQAANLASSIERGEHKGDQA